MPSRTRDARPGLRGDWQKRWAGVAPNHLWRGRGVWRRLQSSVDAPANGGLTHNGQTHAASAKGSRRARASLWLALWLGRIRESLPPWLEDLLPGRWQLATLAMAIVVGGVIGWVVLVSMPGPAPRARTAVVAQPAPTVAPQPEPTALVLAPVPPAPAPAPPLVAAPPAGAPAPPAAAAVAPAAAVPAAPAPAEAAAPPAADAPPPAQAEAAPPAEAEA